jgi:hypothetical protein
MHTNSIMYVMLQRVLCLPIQRVNPLLVLTSRLPQSTRVNIPFTSRATIGHIDNRLQTIHHGKQVFFSHCFGNFPAEFDGQSLIFYTSSVLMF